MKINPGFRDSDFSSQGKAGARDLFSTQAKAYAKYRPSYPIELFDYILQFVNERNCAWDCATGNGQAAVILSRFFKNVEACDLSETQIKNAFQKENIHYSVCEAEKTNFAGNSFDLITIAQAYHWIDWDGFHKEALRVGKNKAVVAIWAYNLFTSDDHEVDQLLQRFYFEIVGPYWDAERKYVDENYESVKFDFELLPSKTFETKLLWRKEDFVGYLSSWSAVQHYIKKKGASPVDLIKKNLDQTWGKDREIEVRFPIFLRLGRILK